jgi:orotate phosphoribosyltransferase-like protein
MESANERVEKLLALLLVQNIKGKKEQAVHLSLAGFSNVEIADILQTSNATISQLLYESRKSRRKGN